MHYKYTYIYFYNIFNLLVIFLTNFCEILFFFGIHQIIFHKIVLHKLIKKKCQVL